MRRGFTIIELLIVVSVLIILMSSVAFSFSSMRIKLRFQADVSRAMAMFRDVRNLAITNRDVSGVDVESYRISFDKSVSPQVVKTFMVDVNDVKTPIDAMELAEGFSMDIKVGGQIGVDPNTSVGLANIDFLPPYGDVRIFSGVNDYRKVKIEFTNQFGDVETMTINDVAGVPERE